MSGNGSIIARPDLVLGARVRLNDLGRERHPKQRTKIGKIVGRGSPSSRRVLFDGLKATQTIHQDYLEIVTDGSFVAAEPQTIKVSTLEPET